MNFDVLFVIDHANLAVMAVYDGLGDGQARAANYFSIRLSNLQKSVDKKGDFVIGNRRTGDKNIYVDLERRDFGPNLNLRAGRRRKRGCKRSRSKPVASGRPIPWGQAAFDLEVPAKSA